MLTTRMSAATPTLRRASHGTDARGLVVTGGSAADIAAIDQFRDTVLRRGRETDRILDAVVDGHECPMVLACAAAVHLLGDTRAGVQLAVPLLERAARTLPGASDREATFVAALSAIARDDARLAASAFLALAADAPDDLLAGYIGHLHFLNHGQTDAMLTQARLLTRANPQDPFALGMLSFALHEIGAIDAAWDAAMAADAIEPSIAWVHHAAGHIFRSRRQDALGVQWLAGKSDHWQSCGSSMFTHNFWHTALLMLEMGEGRAVLGLYDRLIAGEATRSVSSFVNAASLLARVERLGVDVGARWAPLAEVAAPRIAEHVLPFIDLHYALALARHGDVAACGDLQRSAWQHAMAAAGGARKTWIAAGLPVLAAVVAYGLGDRRRAAQGFDRGLPELWRVGGSHQQRGLFHALGADCAGARCAAPSLDHALADV